jgi:hypothetical protein
LSKVPVRVSISQYHTRLESEIFPAKSDFFIEQFSRVFIHPFTRKQVSGENILLPLQMMRLGRLGSYL